MTSAASAPPLHGRTVNLPQRSVAGNIPLPRQSPHDRDHLIPISPAHLDELARQRGIVEQERTDIAAGW